MGKNVKRPIKSVLFVIVLALILFLLLLPARYMNSVFGYVPGIMFAALLILSVVSINLIHKKISIETDYADVECERGSGVSIGLKIANGARLFCPKLAANIFISDIFSSDYSLTKSYFTMPPKTKTDLGFDMDMRHIGVYHVGIRDMQIFDFSGFFKKKVKISGEFDVFVKPKLRELEEIHTAEEVLAESNNETRTSVVNGADYVGTREYEVGDSMKTIHWKLSAHTRDYMTKLYESSRQMDFSVILDFATEENPDREELMDLNDCLIETALSVIAEIAKQHTQYSLIYCNREKQVRRVSGKGLWSDNMALVKDFAVIHPEPEPDFPDARQMVEDENSTINRSTNVIVCTSRVTEELIQAMLRVRRQRRNPELYYIVPARFTSRDLERKKAALRQLDEASVTYHFVTTAENLKARSQKEWEAV